MKVFYGRVSTTSSHQDSSIYRQEELAKKYECDLILVERESGRGSDRLQYQKMLDLIKSGKVSIVIATRSDRLGRDYHELNYFYALCTKYGTHWEFIEEPEANSRSPWGEEIRRRKAYEAEQESYRLGKRQEQAYKFSEDSGKVFFRRPPLGYRANQQQNAEIDWLTSGGGNAILCLDGELLASGEIALKLKDLYVKHGTLRQSLKHWKEWIKSCEVINQKAADGLLKRTASFVREWLEDPTLRGHTAYGKYRRESFGEKLDKKRFVRLPKNEWRIQYNTHPDQVLITESEFKFIQKNLEQNHNKGIAIALSKSDPEQPRSLTGILRCDLCKLTMISCSTRAKGKLYRYYYCSGKKDFKCQSKGISEKQIIKLIVPAITQKATQLVSVIEQAKSGGSIADPERKGALEKEIADAYNKYNSLKIEAFLSLAKTLEQQLSAIEATQIQEVKRLESREVLLLGLSDPGYWNHLSPQDLHRYLKAIVQTCWVNGRDCSLRIDLDE